MAINGLIDRVCYFIDELNLSINASKSSYNVFRKSKNKEVNQNIYINGHIVHRVPCIKYLGIVGIIERYEHRKRQ